MLKKILKILKSIKCSCKSTCCKCEAELNEKEDT